ncbi:uncharacterized protein ARMOST_14465 [Armillaria ostoyae]|uniref:Uncharacterized protein n=1 Tax=Armillaria ostoyae TaxID=47428 RepID=A0A284RQP7_ARMOS|nr:uncharacterized protein ARMOST_14465 [Armillaria ostoyae]
MLEHYPTVLTTEILEIKTRLFGPPEPTLKKGQRGPHADARPLYASSTILRDKWPLPSTNKTSAIEQALTTWVPKDKDTVDEVRKRSLPAEIPIFPPSATFHAPCDDLSLSILQEDDALSKRRGYVALDDDGKRENLKGGSGYSYVFRSVPDQRDVGCSTSHRDNVSSSSEQGQHSSGVMDE